ncbi:MAG: hypothetical protein IKR39_06220 [Lachnospiraceae bacterium]|nr:hypothetical protein [Lachnospiraceae bacterium]
MGNRKLLKMAKTVLAVVLAIMVILPSTLGRPIGGKPVGDNTIGKTAVVYSALGDEDDGYHVE